MYTHTDDVTYEIEDALAEFHDGQNFPDCDATVHLQRDVTQRGVIRRKSIDGELTFDREPPEYLLFDHNDVPRQHDLVLENAEAKLAIEGMLATSEVEDETVEFVAMDTEYTEFNYPDEDSLGEALAEHWPPHTVLVKCEECGATLYDSRQAQPAMDGPSYMAELIMAFARQHDAAKGHRNIDVAIDTHPTPVRDIDCTITVGD